MPSTARGFPIAIKGRRKNLTKPAPTMRSSRASSFAVVPNKAGRISAGVASAIVPAPEREIVAVRVAAIEPPLQIAAPGKQAATAVLARVNSAVAATAAVAVAEAAPIKAPIVAEVPPGVPASGVAPAGRVLAVVVAQEAVAVAQEVAAVVADAVGKKVASDECRGKIPSTSGPRPSYLISWRKKRCFTI